MSSPFTLAIRVDGIATITIDVAGESMNTLKAEFVPAMNEILAKLETHHGLRGVIINSAKPGCFVAGADIGMIAACRDAASATALSRAGQQVFSRLWALKVPVVAAIDGVCLGGGLELALACHYRVCTTSDKTKLGLPEVQLGLLPGAGGTQRLPKLVGAIKALELMLTGRQLYAKQALKLGLVDEVVPATALEQAAIALIGRGMPQVRRRRKRNLLEWLLEATHPGRQMLFKKVRAQTEAKTLGNYPAPLRIIDAVERGLADSTKAGYGREADAFGELAMTPQSAALRQIFFASTELKKARLVDAEPLPLTKVAVIGGGLMGAGIAYVTATKAGLPVRIKEVNEGAIGNALRYSHERLEPKLRKKLVSRGEFNRQWSRLSGATRYVGFAGTELVVEAVFEDLALKHTMVREVEEALPGVIFASNTSSLPIAAIAEAATAPERVVGLHYFSPVEKMPLVEVIPHAGTAPEVVATVVELARQQGKTAIVVKDAAGFYVNRILAPYIAEAGRLLAEGEPVERIDRLLTKAGFPVGPFNLLDEVGLDVGSKIVPVLESAFGSRFAAPATFAKLLEDGRKGRKSGKGFYLYPSKGKKGPRPVDDSIYKLLGVEPQPRLAEEELVDRCLLLMLNEAARCHDEGIVASARDGDIGAVFGIGFPPFLGGPFRDLDRRGAAAVVARLEVLAERYGERFSPCDALRQRAASGETYYPQAVAEQP